MRVCGAGGNGLLPRMLEVGSVGENATSLLLSKLHIVTANNAIQLGKAALPNSSLGGK